ncbi:hypothetical protein ONZ45_g12772 [Pleurotus djamor]|nr:hypothetical protein ONZ45_g12772 [Pleurotus djamor]
MPKRYQRIQPLPLLYASRFSYQYPFSLNDDHHHPMQAALPPGGCMTLSDGSKTRPTASSAFPTPQLPAVTA